jgi:hypothetical protein
MGVDCIHENALSWASRDYVEDDLVPLLYLAEVSGKQQESLGDRPEQVVATVTPQLA